MYLAIDVVLIAVMAAAVFKGVKRGFVKSLFSLLTVVVSIILAVMFYKELSVYINDEFIYEPINSYISRIVADAASNGGTLDGDSIVDSLPDGLRTVSDVLGINLDDKVNGLSGVPEDIANDISAQFSKAVSDVTAFVCVFFVSFIALGVLCYVLDTFAKLPVLHGINKTFGLLFGVCEAFILGVLIAKAALSICGVYGTVNNDPAFLEAAEKTVVAKFLLSLFPW